VIRITYTTCDYFLLTFFVDLVFFSTFFGALVGLAVFFSFLSSDLTSFFSFTLSSAPSDSFANFSCSFRFFSFSSFNIFSASSLLISFLFTL